MDFSFLLTPGNVMAALGGLILLGALCNKLSSRFNLPILLLFLIVGLGLGKVINIESSMHFNFVNYLGTVAMAFILFSGGLDTSFSSVKKVLVPGGILATVGVFITALIFAVCMYCLLLYRSPEHIGEFKYCFLIGAIISSTDAATVFAILRGKGVGVKGKLQPLIELESGSNDPMAYFLTLFALDFALGKAQFDIYTIPLVIWRMAMGVGMGIVMGFFGKVLYKIKLDYEGLYFVFKIAIVLLAYGLTERAHGNGMMACYVCGITMAHLRFNFQKGMTRFSDGVSWLMQVILFTTLGLCVNVSVMGKVWKFGLLFSLILMFIARPLAIFICSIFSSLSFKEKTFISWVGLRGAAPIVLATFPLATGGVPKAEQMFALVFIMVVSSMLIQGMTLMPVARLLGVAKEVTGSVRMPLELEVTHESLGREMKEFCVAKDAEIIGKSLAEADIPKGVLVTMIRRNNELISPRGDTVLQADDVLQVIASCEAMEKFEKQYFNA
jgi:cell volume regulation protein A